MGILNDLKKLFFGASSVSKHAAEKTGNYIKEETEEIIDTTKDKMSQAADAIVDKTSGLKDSITENSKDLMDKAKDKMNEIAESPVVQKAADISEKVGEKVIEKGSEMAEKGAQLSEEVGKKVLEVKDELVEKAKQAAADVGEKLNETMDKAEAWAEAEKQKPKEEFAQDDLDTSGSLLEGTDDFFDKASKYADGDYDAFSEGKITIEESVSEASPSDPEPASGFEDLDGDGNEIIDDAIVEEVEVVEDTVEEIVEETGSDETSKEETTQEEE